jgi:hypothetical protein
MEPKDKWRFNRVKDGWPGLALYVGDEMLVGWHEKDADEAMSWKKQLEERDERIYKAGQESGKGQLIAHDESYAAGYAAGQENPTAEETNVSN